MTGLDSMRASIFGVVAFLVVVLLAGYPVPQANAAIHSLPQSLSSPMHRNKGIERSVQHWAQLERRLEMQSPVKVWNAGLSVRFTEDFQPANVAGPEVLSATACRNETVSFQLAVYADAPLSSLRVTFDPWGQEEAAVCSARVVDFVETGGEVRVADILDEDPTRDMPAGRVQPIWLTLRVPADAQTGRHEGAVTIRWDDEGIARFPISLDVLDVSLPDPRDYKFYLDLWQHPTAIARYHRVALWSEPHWALTRAYTRMLAEAGQKPITVTLFYDPWASQIFDPHAAMVDWVRNEDGNLSFDFSIFDRYVEMCLEEGLHGPIACYSLAMGPGDRMDCPIRCFDRALGKDVVLDMQVGDAAWRAAWEAFFSVFVPHLEARGWLANTCIAIDEANEKKMEALMQVVPPNLKISLAGNMHPEIEERLFDYCIIYPGPTAEISRARRDAGKITTFYTCCAPEFPNTFTISPLVESRLLAWHALNIDADGYLRWAFASWPEDPLADSRFGAWPAGDTFLVYPGPRSSTRFELLKAGIQDFEAFHLARERAPGDPRLSEALRLANAEHDGRKADPEAAEKARALVNAVLAD